MTIRAALAEVRSDATTNLALWLDRFPAAHGQEEVRQHNVNAVEAIHPPEGYAAAFRRRELSLMRYAGGYGQGGAGADDAVKGQTRFLRVTLDGRAIVGIGVASVRETGLTLLRPWGVPVIPGSALKGLAARTAHAAGGEWQRPEQAGGDAKPLHRILFGDVTSAGAVVFHDAWWVPESSLGVHTDTMTVHHVEYYKGSGAPSDTDEPTPVSFLSVSGCYQLALSGPGEAIEVAEAILRQGLRESGVGAKTAAGYGRASLEFIAPERPPLSVRERLEEALGEHAGWRAEVQVSWLLKNGRQPLAGATDAEWKQALREYHPAGIAQLAAGGGDGRENELRAELSAHRESKPKQKKGKEFKAWKKKLDRLEKDIKNSERAAKNRAKEAQRVEAFLSWLEGVGSEHE